MGNWTTIEIGTCETRYINRNRLERKALRIPGVYVFLAGNEVVYVGSSECLDQRIKSHPMLADICRHAERMVNRGKLNASDKMRIKVRPERIPFERLTLEAKLINRLSPAYNVQHKTPQPISPRPQPRMRIAQEPKKPATIDRCGKIYCRECGAFCGIKTQESGPYLDECHKRGVSSCDAVDALSDNAPLKLAGYDIGRNTGPVDADSGGYQSVALRALED